jgi:hypothetical protein
MLPWLSDTQPRLCEVSRLAWPWQCCKDRLSLHYEFSSSQPFGSTPIDFARHRRFVRVAERFAALRRSESPPDVRTIVRRIFEQYPDPPDLPSRDYDVYDRRAAGVAILRKLRTFRR